MTSELDASTYSIDDVVVVITVSESSTFVELLVVSALASSDIFTEVTDGICVVARHGG